jgi:hypothetical protein
VAVSNLEPEKKAMTTVGYGLARQLWRRLSQPEFPSSGRELVWTQPTLFRVKSLSEL